MTKIDLIILNLEEIRRRSVILWKNLPEESYFWKPDKNAMSAIEMIRHVVSADYGWNIIVKTGGDLSGYKLPWDGQPYRIVEDEIDFAQPYRQEFLNTIRQFSETDLTTKQIIHPGTGTIRKLGDYLLRIGYHESVHAGMFLSYLRTMNIDRPFIWD
ncbi:MAG: DinB family protein [Saprospiraceae bacterium]|nr:DinB family protein [Saprospiraceae bacterium]